MITNDGEYQTARQELQDLEQRLTRLLQEHTAPSKGLTKAGVRKMIARLHEELAVYEGTQEINSGK